MVADYSLLCLLFLPALASMRNDWFSLSVKWNDVVGHHLLIIDGRSPLIDKGKTRGLGLGANNVYFMSTTYSFCMLGHFLRNRVVSLKRR